MLLQNKNAVFFAAGGSVGGAIARAMAKAGSTVYLSNHHIEPVQKLADEIISEGGKAEAAKVDALNEKEVNDYINEVVKKAGAINVSMNLISTEDLQGIPLVDLAFDDFVRPVRRVTESHFITGTAAGRVMMKQGFGVILSLTATPGGIGYPITGGFGPACSVIEKISLSLASELGPYHVRVVNIRSAGSPDSKPFRDAIAHGGDKAVEFIKKIEDDTMLKKMPLMNDIANVAVFLSSEMAEGITGVTVDVTCGTTTSLNYKLLPVAFIQKSAVA
ncbi:MAG TPA: SDR family oxidoreductase [Chitinophagaceae bacterium]|jgi:enoyl-[acyl-carrier-protein] reductase (NADH)|nr:SDR family oxidoreductase [Chitinophagaceae bacterium]